MPPACNKMAGHRHNLRLLGFNDGHGPFHAAAARAPGIIGPRLSRHWRAACQRAPGWAREARWPLVAPARAALQVAGRRHGPSPPPALPRAKTGLAAAPGPRSGSSLEWADCNKTSADERSAGAGWHGGLVPVRGSCRWNSCWLCCDPRASVHTPPTGKSGGDALIVRIFSY
jgi:hypothetical protein